jgi:hypothetical protein
VVNTAGNRIKKAGAKSEKLTWLNCTIHPFAKQFFDTISSLQLIADKEPNVFFSVKHL